MMRRIAIAVMATLGFGSPVFADCGWVLWSVRSDRSDVDAQGRDREPTGTADQWTVLDGHAEITGCHAAIRSLRQQVENAPEVDGFKARTLWLDDRSRVTLLNRPNGSTLSYTDRHVCLPGSLDPRPRAGQ
jgi:hypothetical protein